MDKETLSNYGWIVICVLVLAVLLALASPFGTFVAGAIKSTTAGFFSVNQNAMGAAGITIPGQEFESCEHNYVPDIEVNCDTIGTITHTCTNCGDTYTEERETAKHTFDNPDDMNCNVCNMSFTAYSFIASRYDAEMGTTTATDSVVIIPETFKQYKVTSIGYEGFSSCTSLTSVTIPDSVTVIGQRAFQNCTALKNINIPESVTQIYRFAFTRCTSLEEIIIPDSVTTIEYCLFASCESLKSIIIPDTITSIDIQAFMDCYSLTSVVIGKSVNHIGTNVFYDCSLLTEITFNGTTEEWNATTLGSNWNKNVPASYVQCSDGQVSLK